MWCYNTQRHRTVDDIPYRLVFGKKPRVGISGLHLDDNLLDKIATEADLNKVCNYEGKEEDVVGAGVTQLQSGEDEVVGSEEVVGAGIVQLQSGDEEVVSPEKSWARPLCSCRVGRRDSSVQVISSKRTSHVYVIGRKQSSVITPR